MTRWLLCLIAASLSALTAQAEGERDPFMPFVWEQPATVQVQNPNDPSIEANPLTEKPLSSYKLIGLVVSPTDAVAVIKSRDKREFFANIGDQVGSEGGIVDTISTEGITLDVNGKLVNLNVNNRFELQNEDSE